MAAAALVALALLLPSPGSAATSGAAPPLEPVAAYATRPELVDPTLSPDGQVLATSFRSDGEQVLIAHSLFAKQDPKLLRLGKTTLNWIHWPSDDYLVVSLRKMEGIQGELYPFDRLFLMRRDLSEARQISPRSHSGLNGDEVIYWAPDGSYLLLSMSKSVYDWPEVLRIELPSGRSSRVVREREGISWWIASQTGEVDAGIGRRRSGNWRVIYRPAPGKPFTKLTSLRDDQQNANAAGDGADGDGEDLWIVNLDSETRKGHVLAYQGRDQLGLYEYDFAARAFGKAIFADDRFDIDNFHFRRGQLRWVSYVDDRWRIRWFDESIAAFYADLEKAVAGKIAFVTSESRDGAVRLVQTRSPTDPGTFYVYTDASGKMKALGQVNRALEGKVLAPTDHVSYPARDGLTIPGYLTLPVGRPPAGLPLVVMPHGGPFMRDTWDYDFLVQYLANRGYVVLQPNFRGSTGYGRSYEQKGYAQWGKAMQDDVDDGVKWLVASGKVDPARVCIVGWSYGGYAAQVAAFRNPDLYRCAVSVAGISDLAAMLRYDQRFMYGSTYREWRSQVQGDAAAADLATVSSLPRVKDIAMPLLLVHGTEDDRVPVVQSDKLAKALQEAGRTSEYVRIKGGDHSLAEKAQRVQLLTALDAFLARHNPTDVLTAPPAP